MGDYESIPSISQRMVDQGLLFLLGGAGDTNNVEKRNIFRSSYESALDNVESISKVGRTDLPHTRSWQRVHPVQNCIEALC